MGLLFSNLMVIISLALVSTACQPGISRVTELRMEQPDSVVSGPASPGTETPGVPDPFMTRATSIALAMSDRELAGQLIMTGVDGTGRIPESSRQLIADLLPGAVLLFGYNIPADPLELGLLDEDLRQLWPPGGLKPFIAVDHEGGSVFRFKSGLTRLPAAETMAGGGLEAARLAGRIAGTELASLGISMNLAPVFEALDSHNAAFLGSRAWSRDTGTAAALAAAFATSCQAAGVAAVAKHFPGNAALDPHQGLPVLDIGLDELESRYLQAFAAAVAADTAAVMLSHVMVPVVDPDLPFTLSAAGIGLLREKLGFTGVIMSDDLAMAAIAGDRTPSAAALMALDAGVDMVMVSGTRQAMQVRDSIVGAIGTGQLDRATLVESASRILSWKLRLALDRDEPDEREARRTGLASLVRDNRVALESLLGR
ncbi:MAG: glycoside hydrolase family 3 N-terminal domain-containing protein [Clostridia bacterium]